MTLGISQDGFAYAVVTRDPQISVVSSKKEFTSINAAFPSLETVEKKGGPSVFSQ